MVKKKLCAIHESACIVYASSMHDYAGDMRRLSVIMHQYWFETTHVQVRTCSLTPHLHIKHEPGTHHVHRGTKVLVRETFAKHVCLDPLRQ